MDSQRNSPGKLFIWDGGKKSGCYVQQNFKSNLSRASSYTLSSSLISHYFSFFFSFFPPKKIWEFNSRQIKKKDAKKEKLPVIKFLLCKKKNYSIIAQIVIFVENKRTYAFVFHFGKISFLNDVEKNLPFITNNFEATTRLLNFFVHHT